MVAFLEQLPPPRPPDHPSRLRGPPGLALPKENPCVSSCRSSRCCWWWGWRSANSRAAGADAARKNPPAPVLAALNQSYGGPLACMKARSQGRAGVPALQHAPRRRAGRAGDPAPGRWFRAAGPRPHRRRHGLYDSAAPTPRGDTAPGLCFGRPGWPGARDPAADAARQCHPCVGALHAADLRPRALRPSPDIARLKQYPTCRWPKGAT